jgi:hypothetical protein
MGNESLKYAKGAKKSFVEGYFNKKVASTPKNISASEAFVYDVANDQREFFKPIFANETKYLPNVRGSELVSDYSQKLDNVSSPLNMEYSSMFKSSFPNKESLTIPPNKKADDIIKFIVIGGALFLVYQILTD